MDPMGILLVLNFLHLYLEDFGSSAIGLCVGFESLGFASMHGLMFTRIKHIDNSNIIKGSLDEKLPSYELLKNAQNSVK